MKVLFIGGTGNISSSTSRLCLSRGIDLWILNRNGTGDLAGAKSLQADIGNPTSAALLGSHRWDVVVNWIAFDTSDIERDVALFSGKTDQYIFISSASCYKKPGPTPFITERTPLENPYWEYSRRKIAAEQRLAQAGLEQGFPYTIVRPSHTYDTVIPLTIGGWNEYTTVDRMKKGLPIVVQGDGTSLWTITHADDFAQGFAGLLGNAEAIGEDFHITSDEFLSWNEIYQLTAQAVGVKAEIVHVTTDRICRKDPAYRGTLLGDKSASTLFDNGKIKRVVPDFRCAVPFADGIKRTLMRFEEDPSRQIVSSDTNRFLDELVAEARG